MTGGKSIYDAVIIGAGLGGLLVANHLEQQGWRVALIDEQDQPGGFCRGREINSALMEYGIKMVPLKNWDPVLFEEVVGCFVGNDGAPEPIQALPQIYEGGKWVPFLGFGANGPVFLDELDYYLTGEFISWTKGPAYWVQVLKNSLKKTEILNKSIVTQLLPEKDRVGSLLINGQKKLVAKEYIYCAPLARLPKIISADHGVPRWQQKIAKRSLWTSVSLGMVVNELISESRGIHLFKSNTDRNEVFWGTFSPFHNDGSGAPFQITQWMTLLNGEETDLEEAVSSVIRKLRKMLVKAFPTLSKPIGFERILVAEESHGLMTMPQGEPICWPTLSNLWLATHNLSLQRNLIGVISQAKRVLDNLTGEPSNVKRSPQEILEPSFRGPML